MTAPTSPPPSVATTASAVSGLRPCAPLQRATRLRVPFASAARSLVAAAAAIGTRTSPKSTNSVRTSPGSVASARPPVPFRRTASSALASLVRTVPEPAGTSLPSAPSPNAPADKSSSMIRHWLFSSNLAKTASAERRSHPPSWSWVTWTPSGTSRTKGITVAFERARPSLFVRFSRSLGVCSSRWEKIPSRSPYAFNSLAAVFSPTPGMPGRLSDGSPRSEASNTYFDGGTPQRSTMPASS